MAPCIIKMNWWWQHHFIYMVHGAILSPIWFSVFLSTEHVACEHLKLKSILLAFTKYLYRYPPWSDSQSAYLHLKSRLLPKTNEPEQDKTNKMICAPSEDSDQTGYLPNLISLRCLHEETMKHKLPTECTAKILIRLCWCEGWSES